jgi:hypothetical protein
MPSMMPEVVAMSRAGQISRFHIHVPPLGALRRHSRCVEVKVLEYGCETDRFSLSDPRALRAELRTMQGISSEHHVLELTGIEEEWLPMGLNRVRRETPLKSSAEALSFLAA